MTTLFWSIIHSIWNSENFVVFAFMDNGMKVAIFISDFNFVQSFFVNLETMSMSDALDNG